MDEGDKSLARRGDTINAEHNYPMAVLLHFDKRVGLSLFLARAFSFKIYFCLNPFGLRSKFPLK
jgi:hypothetical protein